MHASDTIDCGLVLSGAPILELDDGETSQLAPGDTYTAASSAPGRGRSRRSRPGWGMTRPGRHVGQGRRLATFPDPKTS